MALRIDEKEKLEIKNLLIALKRGKWEDMGGLEALAFSRAFYWLESLLKEEKKEEPLPEPKQEPQKEMVIDVSGKDPKLLELKEDVKQVMTAMAAGEDPFKVFDTQEAEPEQKQKQKPKKKKK